MSRKSRALGIGWSSFSGLQILAMWSEDSGSDCYQRGHRNKSGKEDTAELEILAVKVHDAGEYYCRANNGCDSIGKNMLNISLHCVAQRGSPPILYQFYHKDVNLGSSLIPSQKGAFFNLSVTIEQFANYSCEADKALRHSEAVLLFLSDGLVAPQTGA
ncbi:Fc receptor-like protein 2 [Sorex araneus]|uniref:Fc receptor-like protein 2 n=1 Tax=Sorex araneus TaxID=42254 RepID=UPI002433F4C8|nr:Fc receptor-like protein 2 [Sorex araneus]